jgi:hypothetical protein
MQGASDYRTLVHQQAYGSWELRWLRGLVIGGVATPIGRFLGIVTTPLGIVVAIAIFTILAAISWEVLRYLRRRFYDAPLAVYREQLAAIARLESMITNLQLLLEAAQADNLALQNRLRTKRKNVLLAHKLVELRTYGLHQIRNEYEADAAHIKQYLKREQEWREKVEAEMRSGGCSEAEICSFSDITTSEIDSRGEDAVRRFGAQGGWLIGLMEIRLQRLANIVDRYSDPKLFSA